MIANEKAQEEAELLKEEGNGLFKVSCHFLPRLQPRTCHRDRQILSLTRYSKNPNELFAARNASNRFDVTVLVQEGRFDDALFHYEKAIALHPLNAKLRCNRAACYTSMGKTQQASTRARTHPRSAHDTIEKPSQFRDSRLRCGRAAAVGNTPAVPSDFARWQRSQAAADLMRAAVYAEPDYTRPRERIGCGMPSCRRAHQCALRECRFFHMSSSSSA